MIRFLDTPSPAGSIASYLLEVHEEATRRGYRFDASKIATPAGCADLIAATEGQLDFEWAHLREKLRLRAPSWLAGFRHLSRPDPHPLFYLVPGVVAEWEVASAEKRPKEGCVVPHPSARSGR